MAENRPRACRNLMAEFTSVECEDSKEKGETSRQELQVNNENVSDNFKISPDYFFS